MSENIKDLIKYTERYERLSKKININNDFLFVDYSKTHITSKILDSKILEFTPFIKSIKSMRNKEKINFTEDRSVLHTHCRSKKVIDCVKNGKVKLEDVEQDFSIGLKQIERFCNDFHNNKILGSTGKPLKTVVNIGIGGSDLGPRMVTHALSHFRVIDNIYFISNIDPTEIDQVFEKINIRETLFIVVSKTFTTAETLCNAKLARKKVCESLNIDESEANKHFVAVTADVLKAQGFGINTTFIMSESIGGRYSLWSPCGLSISLYIGFNNFIDLLYGASCMDDHFFNNEPAENIPILHALVEDYYNNTLKYDNCCILPYDSYLKLLPAYLQQAEMESNGKSSSKHPEFNKNTGMIIWGGIGTDCQHSFFQLIHQGTRNILCEFILPLKTHSNSELHHQQLLSNCLAQSRALMIGKSSDNPHKDFKGNKPSITLAYSNLTPSILGSIIALYEHKIVVQGFLWGINSFDQFGVTLGKSIAKEIQSNINNPDSFDISTKEILKMYLDLNSKKN